MHLARQKAFWVIAATAVLLTCRMAIPLSIEGDWMGSLTKCACNMYSFVRFEDGHAIIYGHGGEPEPSPQNLGTYTKIARNTYRLDTTRWNRGVPITVKAGWFFSSFEGVQGNSTFYCWRYPLHRKADWIVRESQRMAVEERKARADERTKK